MSDKNTNANSNETTQERTWTETVEVAGSRLVDEVKGLLKEGDVRRLIIRKENGDMLLEIPLSAGVVVGGVMIFALPMLTALGAIAALVAKFRIEIVRTQPLNDDADVGVEHIEVIEE